MRMIPVHCIYACQGILLPYLIMSFRIFLLRQHVASAIPAESLEAAQARVIS